MRLHYGDATKHYKIFLDRLSIWSLFMKLKRAFAVFLILSLVAVATVAIADTSPTDPAYTWPGCTL